MGRRLTDEEREWRRYSEKEFQSKVMKQAREEGWLVAHFHDSRKMVNRKIKGKWVQIPIGDKDAKGFPDICMVHPGFGVVFLELKKELGKTSPEQDEWLAALQSAGQKAFVARPSDWEFLLEGMFGGFPEP